VNSPARIAGDPYVDLTVGKAAPLPPDVTPQLRVVRDAELDQRTRQVVHSIATLIADATRTNRQEATAGPGK
jgi:hypothetical protein